MIESNFLDEFVRRGHQQGFEQGRAESLDTTRRLCIDMLREYHPRLVSKLAAHVRACTDGERLRTWILRTPRLDDEACTRLVRQRGQCGRGRCDVLAVAPIRDPLARARDGGQRPRVQRVQSSERGEGDTTTRR